MKTTFRKSFAKDLKTHSRDKNLLARIQEIILGIESADNITSIKNLKKLKTESSYYRIRVGNTGSASLLKMKLLPSSGFSTEERYIGTFRKKR